MYYNAQYLHACAICACTLSAHAPYTLRTMCFELLDYSVASLYLNQLKSEEKEGEKETKVAIDSETKRKVIGLKESPRQTYRRAVLRVVQKHL